MKSLVLRSLMLAAVVFSAPAVAQEEVRIGLIEPLTGSVAYNGNSVVEGAKLAIAEVNAAGGVLGKQVKLMIEDGQCQPATSVNAVEKLVQKDKAVLLVGAFWLGDRGNHAGRAEVQDPADHRGVIQGRSDGAGQHVLLPCGRNRRADGEGICQDSGAGPQARQRCLYRRK